MKIEPLNDWVIVTVGKKQNNTVSSLFEAPENSHNHGVIRYLAPNITTLSVGQSIFFGNQREKIQINGEDVLVMHLNNVFAKKVIDA